MQVIGYTDNIDLRTVGARSTYLKRIAKRNNLQNGQAIVFTNRSMTRFRLVFKVNNVIFMCIPEVDEKSKLSVYLRISQELADLAKLKDTRVELDLLALTTKERIQRKEAYWRARNKNKANKLKQKTQAKKKNGRGKQSKR